MKIIGVFVVKNEWPFLALSISHALIKNCDEVIVIDNGSTDSSVIGMRELQKEFPNRIHIFEYLGAFNQAAIVGAGVRIARELGADFVVSLDADEFLVVKSMESLKAFIVQKKMGDEYTSIRVGMENFVVPKGFNEHNLCDFSAITFRVNPTQNQISTPLHELIPMISSGEVGILDNHFWNFKVILMMRDDAFLTAGNHQTTKEGPIYFASNDEIVWAHIPFRRASKVIRRNFSDAQNEIASHYSILDALSWGRTDDEIWSLVTLDEDYKNPRIPLCEDKALVSSLLPVIELLAPIWNHLSRILPNEEIFPNGQSQSERLLLNTLIDLTILHLGKDFTDQVQIT
jgi:glycosyltransferase involved in cell wall biosynthesis